MQYWVYGCGGHARSVCDVIKNMNPHSEIVMFDPSAQNGEIIMGIRSENKLGNKNNINIFAVGDNFLRKNLFEQDNEYTVVIIAKNAYVSENAVIKKGTFVGDFAHVGPECIINENCIINTAANIEHECIIGAHSHIAPHACICGRSKIGNEVFIGAGAVVIDKIQICSNVIIGAGATVISDITIPGVYAGVPVKKIK